MLVGVLQKLIVKCVENVENEKYSFSPLIEHYEFHCAVFLETLCQRVIDSSTMCYDTNRRRKQMSA